MLNNILKIYRNMETNKLEIKNTPRFEEYVRLSKPTKRNLKHRDNILGLLDKYPNLTTERISKDIKCAIKEVYIHLRILEEDKKVIRNTSKVSGVNRWRLPNESAE